MRNVTPCPNWRELLSAYQDQSLSSKDRKRVAAHLQTCGDCRQALAQMDGDRDRFIEAYMAPAAKTDLRESVLSALRADAETPAQQQPERKFPWNLFFQLGKAGAAVTLILLVAVFMGREPSTDDVAIAPEKAQQVRIYSRYASGDAAGRRTYTPSNSMNSTGHGGINATDDATASGAPEDGTYRASMDREPDNTFALEARNGLAPDYGMNAYLYDPTGNLMPLGQIENPPVGYGNKPVIAYDALSTVVAKGSKIPTEPAGLKMAYDIDYRVQVKNALQKSRQAQGIITNLGGFTMNYQYIQNEHEPAVACFNGKIPADKAEAALAQIEKLGNVRGLTIAGEDLTEQFQANRQEIARQTEHAKKLDAIANRVASKAAASVEDERHVAKGQVDAASQALTGLTTRHELVTISAAFYESQPREPLTFARATAGTRHVLNYALLLLVTIAVFFLLAALVATPFVGLRYWRRRRREA